jgi:thiol-disulfide isomerase/thioredoxin
MGRLQTLMSSLATVLTLCSATTIGCEESNSRSDSGAPTKRNEAILASGTVPSSRAPTSSSPIHPAPPARPKLLCAGAPINRAMPSERLGHAEAPTAAALGETIPTGGRWAWINLWAAWCVPCKEEMPRLLQWQSRLASSMNLHFLSLDDDQRQLLRFLEAQPSNGVRASYWLPEGSARDGWLGALRIKSSPQLPIQILVNPQGRVHCVIEGAVEDSDFTQVASIVSQR